ncbi:MAG TPA: nitroreductase family deazaflavin-dependent oxidoreductase [Chloroflexia bacterium]|nr:nitroreductase family deazaflavin-dependent oxidoreductase [Chloroflexia bacterium]
MATTLAPAASRPRNTIRAAERSAFKLLNRCMVPALRAGLAPFFGSPFTGYFLLLRTTGRKTGLPRYSPLNYALRDGCVYVLAGFGEGTHWLANLRDDSRVRIRLPACESDGTAEVVVGPREATHMAVAVARNSGIALLFEHPHCLFMTGAQLARRLEGRPVVRICPDGAPVQTGSFDPGGRGWLLTIGVQVAALALVWSRLSRRSRARDGELL